MDLTPNWYKVVGRSLLISQFVAAALRMVYLLMRWVHVQGSAGATASDGVRRELLASGLMSAASLWLPTVAV